VPLLGGMDSKNEILICPNVFSNPDGKNDGEQYLVGSFSGALSS
jgi:hypothetical protein